MAGLSAAPRSVLVVAICAALMTVAALVAAFELRQTATLLPRSSVQTAAKDGGPCGGRTCRPIAQNVVGGTTIELLADPGGTAGSLRIGSAQAPGSVGDTFQVSITQNGAQLDSGSLSCVGGSAPACMVRGGSDEGVIGEVFVDRPSGWGQVEVPYLSDAGYLALLAGDAQHEPQVIAVQRNCDRRKKRTCTSPGVYAQVFSLTGAEIGCTQTVSMPASLPGWPAVNPRSGQLRPCP